MNGIEMYGIIIALAVIGIIFNAIKSKGMVNLALRKFEINRDPDAEDIIVLEGRKTGLMSWILVKLKLGNIFSIRVKKEHISYMAESLAGKDHILIPNAKASSTACGYEKPIIWFFLGALLLLGGIIGLFSNIWMGILLIILGLLCFFLYSYMKNFYIRIETFGSMRIGFSFKKSFIENKPIEIEEIEEAVALINELIKKS
ncbi:hypothetical protein LJB84_02785 [Bacteroidales bacterium OttesenSCG-928-J19]|nr:hypothetical protein [Bacteroidales bacterium OttesenSCG-928-J19]